MQRFILPRMASRACPLPLPRSGGCRRCKGEKSFRWKQHDGRNDGELLLPYGVRIYPRLLPPPAHPPPSPPFLSSKRLGLFPSNKVRPGKKEADADPLTRNGHIPVFVPSVAFFHPQHAHPPRPSVLAHSAGIFQRNARAQRRLGNLGERTSLGMPVGGGGPGVRAGLYN